MNNRTQPYDNQELEKMGKNGELWAIEIFYTLNGEVCRLEYRNQTNPQVMSIRRAIFQVGIVIQAKTEAGVPINGTWQVISPMDLGQVFLHKQSGYFP